jgi:hypothetical protein
VRARPENARCSPASIVKEIRNILTLSSHPQPQKRSDDARPSSRRSPQSEGVFARYACFGGSLVPSDRTHRGVDRPVCV